MDPDLFLKKLGIKFEDLDKPGHMGERDAYFAMLKGAQKEPVTVDAFRKAILRMRYAVEMELTDPNHVIGDDKDIFMRARLRNYLLLEAILYDPATAETQYKEDIKRLTTTE